MSTLLLFEGKYCKQNVHCFFPYILRVKFTNLDVFTLYFSLLEGNDLIWNEQGFPPQIQRAGLTTVYRPCGIINCGLHIFFQPTFWKQIFVFKDFFHENSVMYG